MKMKAAQTDVEMYHIFVLKESILWKWLYYPKQPRDVILSLWNYQWHFSELEQKIFTICMATQKTLTIKAIMRKKNGNEGTGFPDFTLCYKAPGNKAVWYWSNIWNIKIYRKYKIQKYINGTG